MKSCYVGGGGSDTPCNRLYGKITPKGGFFITFVVSAKGEKKLDCETKGLQSIRLKSELNSMYL